MQEQWKFLAKENCTAIQGYLIARPMPVAEVFAYLSATLDVPRLRDTAKNRKVLV